MKILSSILLFLLFSSAVIAQKRVDYGVLQRPGEEVIFGFSLKKSNKIVLVCSQKDDKYLVYRFGTKDKMELQYPSILNAGSWKAFRYSGYSRRGVNNSPMEMHSLTFKNNHIDYKIYEDWEGDHHDSDAGIVVNVNGKKTKLTGNASSKNGSLGLLMDKEDLIHNYYDDDTEGH
jgi:hypothetical protein